MKKTMFNAAIVATISSALFITACQQTNIQVNNQLKDQSKYKVQQSDLPKMSVQLWSVNEIIAKDFKGTLTAIAEMGFDAVEFAGDFGPYANDAQGLKNFLDSLELQVSGAHVPLRYLTAEKFQATVDFYKTIGTPMLIVPSAKEAFDPDSIDSWINELNIVEKKVAANGMRFGFHNHDEEFLPYKQGVFWDQIATKTSQSFILQMDVGWVTFADKDPIEYINKYPERTITSHYKAMFPHDKMPEGKLPLIGQDVTNWPAVIVSQIKIGGTKWMVLEQEEYPNGLTQLEAVKVSKQGLDKIIAAMVN